MGDIMNINEHMDCYQLSMELVCEKYNRDIAFYFIDSWDFCYNKTNTALSITSLKSKRKNKDPLRYMGLIPEEIDVQSKLDMSIIKQHVMNKEILLSKLESYYCPWHRGYMETHIPHCFAIVDYNDDGIICVDKYFSTNKHVLLPVSQLNYSNGISLYRPAQNYTQLDINLLLFEIANEEQERQNMFDMMESFIVDLDKTRDPSVLFDYPEDLYLCNITRTLKFIADGRIQLGYLFKKLCQKYSVSEVIVLIYKTLYHCGDLWNIIINLFIKIFYNPAQFEREKSLIYKNVSEIIEIEKKIFHMIKNGT